MRSGMIYAAYGKAHYYLKLFTCLNAIACYSTPQYFQTIIQKKQYYSRHTENTADYRHRESLYCWTISYYFRIIVLRIIPSSYITYK